MGKSWNNFKLEPYYDPAHSIIGSLEDKREEGMHLQIIEISEHDEKRTGANNNMPGN